MMIKTFFDAYPLDVFVQWTICWGILYYVILYHGGNTLLQSTAYQHLSRKMSRNRLKQQVRNAAITPFLMSVVYAGFVTIYADHPTALVRYMGVVAGCYTFELVELVRNQRYVLATHHMVSVLLFMLMWLCGSIPEWVHMENLALFLGWTFAADVAHHLSGLMIHFIGRESMFVRSFLVFSACMYGARMAVGLYCGIYALFFSEGIFAFMLVSVSAFLLVIDRFIWFPKILLAYGLREREQKQQQKQQQIQQQVVIDAVVSSAAPAITAQH